jgi:hypothetical protein
MVSVRNDHGRAFYLLVHRDDVLDAIGPASRGATAAPPSDGGSAMERPVVPRLRRRAMVKCEIRLASPGRCWVKVRYHEGHTFLWMALRDCFSSEKQAFVGRESAEHGFVRCAVTCMGQVYARVCFEGGDGKKVRLCVPVQDLVEAPVRSEKAGVPKVTWTVRRDHLGSRSVAEHLGSRLQVRRCNDDRAEEWVAEATGGDEWSWYHRGFRTRRAAKRAALAQAAAEARAREERKL